MKAIGNTIFVEQIEFETKTASGIILTDTVAEELRPCEGVVVAVGNGAYGHKMTVVNGDKVVYGKGKGQKITLEGRRLLIMNEQDIFAIL